MVLFMNRRDIERLGLRDAQTVDLVGAADDGVERRVAGFRVVAYDVPEGCIGGYYPNAIRSSPCGTMRSAARSRPRSPSRSGSAPDSDPG